MKMRIKKFMFVGCIAALSGCASMPNASVTYYLPKSSANVTVNQTVSCIDISSPVVETNVNIQPVYSANMEEFKIIKFSDLDTFYTSGNAEITLSEDGRIEAFNGSVAGAGNDVLTTFVSIIGILKGVGTVDVKAACKEINRVAGEKAGIPLPLSVTLKSNVVFQKDMKYETTPFEITSYPQSFYNAIMPALGKFEYSIGDAKTMILPVNATDNNVAKITLLNPAIVPIKVIKTSLISNEQSEYAVFFPVPQWGTEYYVPIPKSPMFGTNSLVLSLYSSGKIKTLKYGAANGAKDLGAAFNTLNDSLTQTDSEKAAVLKAEADVIAQQQRLIKCKTTPDECK